MSTPVLPPRPDAPEGATTVLVCSRCGSRLSGRACVHCAPARRRRRAAAVVAAILVLGGATWAVVLAGGDGGPPAPPDPAAPIGTPVFGSDAEADAFSNDTRLWVGAGQVGGAPTRAGKNVVQTPTGAQP